MTTTVSTKKRSPTIFFILVFALSVPLWLIGSATDLLLLPGLPVSSLMAFCPVLAASILVYRDNGTAVLSEFLKRAFDFGRIKSKIWYIPAILLMPGIAVLAYGIMCLLQMPCPTPQFSVVSALVMSLMFFIAALGEELGWTGYAIDPMQDKDGTLKASLLLGVIWAIWHIIPFMQADRSPVWIIWQCLTLVASRVILVWLYNNTGKSVAAAALCHAMINVSWQLFPNQGSHYDPRITGLLTTLVVVIITVIWGPQTLARNKNKQINSPENHGVSNATITE